MVTFPATAALVRQVVAALDGSAVGRIYCDEGGEAFWRARRQPLIDLGLQWAAELARRLPKGGQSLYVGAGVAELPAMLVEAVELRRDVVACTLRGEECEVVNSALTAIKAPLRLRHVDARLCAAAADHVSLVSVLSDPETFPVVSGLTYGRLHPALVDHSAFAAEGEQVRGLLRAVLDGLRRPGWITTTVEEVPWLLAWAESAGVVASADDTMVDTAIVGDPIGFLRVSSP